MANYADRDFVEYIVKQLVNKPENVEVTRKVDEMGVLIEVKVDPEDMGLLIGRAGSTAKAVRTLARIIGMRNNARVNLRIVEPEGSTHVPKASGEKTRNVEDVVNAYLCLAERDARGPYNFSMGDEITVRRMIETICRLMDAPVHVQTLNEPRGMIANQVLDSSRARTELGWKPCYTLEEGLAKTIEWYREYLR